MTYTTNLWNKTPDGFALQEKALGDTLSPSMIARGRASNVALTSVLEKTIAFLPPSVGFNASSIAADYGATYVSVEDVQIKTHDGRYYDKLSALMADQPAGVDEVRRAAGCYREGDSARNAHREGEPHVRDGALHGSA